MLIKNSSPKTSPDSIHKYWNFDGLNHVLVEAMYL